MLPSGSLQLGSPHGPEQKVLHAWWMTEPGPLSLHLDSSLRIPPRATSCREFPDIPGHEADFHVPLWYLLRMCGSLCPKSLRYWDHVPMGLSSPHTGRGL